MKYAIAFDKNEVFQHFGKCPGFLLLEIENGNIISKDSIDALGSGHGALVDLLKSSHVHTLVCGGIGQGAINALGKVGIALISGAKGDIEGIVEQLLNGTLKDDPSSTCNHHIGTEHDCAGHRCSK